MRRGMDTLGAPYTRADSSFCVLVQSFSNVDTACSISSLQPPSVQAPKTLLWYRALSKEQTRSVCSRYGFAG